MWQCPTCGRSFKKKNQNHYCQDGPRSVTDYIAAQPEPVQALLNQIRDTLRQALPEASERISWQMPTYWQNRNLIHFAAFKNHIGIYPGDQAIARFADELAGYRTSKGAWQIPIGEAMPLHLIARIARWCATEENHG